MDLSTGDGALRAAIELEELGRDLYDSLAAISTDPEVVRLCRGLAVAERHHERVLSQLRAELCAEGRNILAPGADLAEARRVLKDTVIPDRAKTISVVDEGSAVDLLKRAAEMEKNAVTFFRSLSASTSEGDVLHRILDEELGHLRSLERLASQMEADALVDS